MMKQVLNRSKWILHSVPVRPQVAVNSVMSRAMCTATPAAVEESPALAPVNDVSHQISLHTSLAIPHLSPLIHRPRPDRH